MNFFMTMRKLLFSTLMVFGAATALADTSSKPLLIPYLEPESQSNISVMISGQERPCPPQYTNSLSNTNLFTSEDFHSISGVFEKYTGVTTNVGPAGTLLTRVAKTNYIVKSAQRYFTNESWVLNCKYTNLNANERITLSGGGLSSRFRTLANDGYDIYFVRSGAGTMLQFWEIKNNVFNGVHVAFEDLRSQDEGWNFRFAQFTTNTPLMEYRQYTNGLVYGKFFMWDPRTRNLTMQAEFKAPYDFEKHRIDLPSQRQ